MQPEIYTSDVWFVSYFVFIRIFDSFPVKSFCAFINFVAALFLWCFHLRNESNLFELVEKIKYIKLWKALQYILSERKTVRKRKIEWARKNEQERKFVWSAFVADFSTLFTSYGNIFQTIILVLVKSTITIYHSWLCKL